MFVYRIYGLNFASTFPLPELGPETTGEPDITVDFGEVPEELPSPSAFGLAWEADKGKMLLVVADVARYLIEDDNKITVQSMDGVSKKEARLFLLGSVLGAVLHAQKMLVLHASVIQTKFGGVLFMGKSGAGKSTTLGAFLKAGYPMLADDKAGIVLSDDGVAHVLSGFPTIRLTKETVNKLGFSVNGSLPSKGLGKYVLPVERFCPESIPVHAVYALSEHNQRVLKIEPLDVFGCFEAVNHNTYRRRFVHDEERRQEHFRIVSALSTQVIGTAVKRPIGQECVAEVVKRIEEDFER